MGTSQIRSIPAVLVQKMKKLGIGGVGVGRWLGDVGFGGVSD
jgi:hypothetical protein